MLSKNQASQIGDELLAQQRALVDERRMGRARSDSTLYRCPELGRFAPDAQAVILRRARAIVLRQWTVHLVALALFLVMFIAWLVFHSESQNFSMAIALTMMVAVNLILLRTLMLRLVVRLLASRATEQALRSDQTLDSRHFTFPNPNGLPPEHEGAISMEISLQDAISVEEVLEIYQGNGWSSSEKPTQLMAALQNSHGLVTARIAGKLVGLGNAISDGHLVVYFPHLLVHPAFQGKGVGRKMMAELLKKYAGFHQQMLTADDKAIGFYESLGFVRAGSTQPMWIYAGTEH